MRWLNEHEQAAWRAFLAMHARLMAQLGREMQASSGLSIADYSVLVEISEQPCARVRILELARSLQWEKSRVSHQLSRMQLRGLVERSSCEEDRRGAWVVLTAAGRDALESVAPDHVASVRRYLFDNVSGEHVSIFSEVCESVLGRLPDGDASSDAEANSDKTVEDDAACPNASPPRAR